MSSILPAPSLPLARSLQTIALDDVHAISAFQLFTSQIDSNSIEAALDGMKRLGVVASAMGATEVVQKLLPYLTNQVASSTQKTTTPPYYADEVLLVLGQEIPTLLKVIGKKHYAEAVPLLERLANVEETVVREQAVTVLQSMAPDMVNILSPAAGSSFGQQSLLVSLVKRLGAADWFTAKVSACGVLPCLLSSSAPATQNQDLLHLYREFCHEDTPMVRRAAAKHLGKVFQSAGIAMMSNNNTNHNGATSTTTATSMIHATVLDFILQTLPTLMNDEQDSVRLLAAASMADAAILSTQPQWTCNHILPLVKQASTDMSWRVRHHLAKNFSSVASNLGIHNHEAESQSQPHAPHSSPQSSPQNNTRLFSNEQSLVMACFVSLLTDVEAEVRASATGHLARMIAWGGPSEFTIHLQPLLPALADDVVLEVRSKTALAIMEAAAASSSFSTTSLSSSSVDRTASTDLIIMPEGSSVLEDAVIIQVFGPLLENFLSDEFHEVQLQVLTNLHKIAHLLPELQTIVTTLLHMSKAGNWRVREAVAKLLPHLCTARGVDFFASVLLEPTWLTLLLDPVAQVRYAICSGVNLLVQTAGSEWILSELLPHHVRIYNAASVSYLIRITLLNAHIEMAMATTDNTLWCDVVLHLIQGLQDKVANVRMVSARGLGNVVHSAQGGGNGNGATTSTSSSHSNNNRKGGGGSGCLSPQMQTMIVSQIRPALEKMQEDDDWDCRQVSQAALDQMIV